MPIPPLTVMSILPSEPPLHVALIIVELVMATLLLSLNVIEESAEQPFASLTVTVYVPDARLSAIESVDPDVHWYV